MGLQHRTHLRTGYCCYRDAVVSDWLHDLDDVARELGIDLTGYAVVARGPCGLCGANPARGYASAWSQATGEVWFCHEGKSPTCYEKSERDDRNPEWMG